jgi:hypothetical protein
MHIVGDLYEDCHDARSLDHKVLQEISMIFTSVKT